MIKIHFIYHHSLGNGFVFTFSFYNTLFYGHFNVSGCFQSSNNLSVYISMFHSFRLNFLADIVNMLYKPLYTDICMKKVVTKIIYSLRL